MSSTIATHQPAESTMVPTARSEWTMRLRRVVGAAMR